MTGIQPWENLAGGTASAKALRQSKLDTLQAQKEGEVFVREWSPIKLKKRGRLASTHRGDPSKMFDSDPKTTEKSLGRDMI